MVGAGYTWRGLFLQKRPNSTTKAVKVVSRGEVERVWGSTVISPPMVTEWVMASLENN